MNTEQTSENISKIFWCIQVKTTKKLYFMEFSKKDNLMKVVKVCVTFTTIYMIRSKMFFWFLQTVKKEGALRYRQVCDCQIKKKLNLSRFEKYTIFTLRQWFFSKNELNVKSGNLFPSLILQRQKSNMMVNNSSKFWKNLLSKFLCVKFFI